MGWTVTPGATREDVLKDCIRPQDFVSREDGSARKFETLAWQLCWGNVLWTVVEYTQTPPGGETTVKRFIGCFLLEYIGDGWGYKDMEEGMHPCYYSCPLEFLDMAPVACPQWRARVVRYHSANPPAPRVVAVRPVKTAPKPRTERFIAMAQVDVSYNHDAKAAFHREGKRVLRWLADAIGYAPGDYDLRSNMGGIAVSGEITLHSDSLYVQFSQSALGPDHGFMWRTCKGRRDYTGRRNQWMRWSLLSDLDAVARTMRACARERTETAA